MQACRLRITILSENSTVREDLRAGHGLSMLVEADGLRVLWDAAYSEDTVHNAAAMGVPLRPLDAIVLSHGHSDHTGGLAAVLQETGPVRLVAHPDAFDRTYATPPGEEPRMIGSPLTLSEYGSLGAQVELSREPVRLSPRLQTTGEVPLGDLRAVCREGFSRAQDGELVPDDLRDDVSLLALLGPGLVLITGCAHAGLGNIVRHAVATTGSAVLAQIGGTHLGPLSEDLIEATAAELVALGLRTMMPCHCTGAGGFEIIKRAFPGEVVAVATGNVVEFCEDGRWTVSVA